LLRRYRSRSAPLFTSRLFAPGLFVDPRRAPRFAARAAIVRHRHVEFGAHDGELTTEIGTFLISASDGTHGAPLRLPMDPVVESIEARHGH
jgi:hypothetical protein